MSRLRHPLTIVSVALAITAPWVVIFGLGAYGALPFDAKQSAEIWITAAQSFFALSILVNFEIDVREALALLVLFCSQVALEFLVLRVLPVADPGALSYDLLIVYTAVYLILGLALFVRRRHALWALFGRTRNRVREAAGRDPIGRAD